MEKKGFFVSLGKRKLGVVLNLFYAYMSLGLVLIMLGAILPDLKADYALSYQVGGALLSVQSVGYVLAGLLAGYLPLLLGIKVSYILIQLSVTLGFIMLLISGNPVWLLIAMLLIGVGKGGITNYNNLLMNIYSEGNAGPLNILHACFAAGAVIAPLIALAVSGWRMAVIIGCVCCVASLVFLVLVGHGPDLLFLSGCGSLLYGMDDQLSDRYGGHGGLSCPVYHLRSLAGPDGRQAPLLRCRQKIQTPSHDPGPDAHYNRVYDPSSAEPVSGRVDHSDCRDRSRHVRHVWNLCL